jgi:hypothetical protein
MQMFRSHGGTVLTVAGRDLSSEASAPGSDAPSRERLAGRGADTPATIAFAGRVLPDTILRGMRMSRSHGGTVPTVSGWNLSSEVSSPSSVTSCRKWLAGRGADTPAISNLSRRHLSTGTAPDCGRTLASCYGSDLLPLRLHSFLQ